MMMNQLLSMMQPVHDTNANDDMAMSIQEVGQLLYNEDPN